MFLVDFEEFIRGAGFERGEFGGFGVGVGGLAGFPAGGGGGGGARLRLGVWLWWVGEVGQGEVLLRLCL